jgi:hypothetical protein
MAFNGGVKMMKQRFMIMGLLVVLFVAVVLTATGCSSAGVSDKGKGIDT